MFALIQLHDDISSPDIRPDRSLQIILIHTSRNILIDHIKNTICIYLKSQLEKNADDVDWLAILKLINEMDWNQIQNKSFFSSSDVISIETNISPNGLEEFIFLREREEIHWFIREFK